MFLTPLRVTEVPEGFRLDAPLVYQGHTHRIEVPAGFVTDFGSVPWWGRWLVPRWGWKWTKAYVIHDYLYRTQPEGWTRKDADGLMRRIHREEGAGALKRNVAWMAVRLGGWRPWSKTMTKKTALLLLLVTPFLGCFAVPEKREKMSDVVALAMGGTPITADMIAALPPEAWGGVDLHGQWYDIVRTIQIDGTRPDGGTHFLDISSGTDAQKGLDARISDNERNKANVGVIANAFMAGVGAATGRPAGVGGTPQPAAPGGGEVTPTDRAILESMQTMNVNFERFLERFDPPAEPEPDDGMVESDADFGSGEAP